jgi:protein-S-isoprenylcysteine O-methyltransferase Ste14
MQDTEVTDNPGVKIPPPLAYLSMLILGIFLHSHWAHGQMAPLYLTLIGAAIAAVGILITLPQARRHKKEGTNVEPWKPTNVIISTGLYGYSRNPIYLGMTLIYLGVSIAAGSLGAALLLPFVLVFMRYYVIAREESYLERSFGEEYLNYKRKVRRWI